MAESFDDERKRSVSAYKSTPDLQNAAASFRDESIKARYSYNFDWCGRPIIQYPQDIVAVQEIIWAVRPDLVIETGIAHGGSIVFSASMLALLDYCDAARAGDTLDPGAPKRKVLAIDIDIRAHNRKAIERHPMSNRIELIEGSSINPIIVQKAHEFAQSFETVLVMLDSNHTYEHVLAELSAYAPLVSTGSYCIVFDTIIEDLPASFFADRPWGTGNNPKTAVDAFLQDVGAGTIVASDGKILKFRVNDRIDDKLLISAAPNGYLERI
jgi:cephalosporin hydroxylase